jgi:DUF2956 family protein
MNIQKTSNAPSAETQAEAMQIAKATQKPGQTKEQTRLVAQGIQKGIELYKKQQKVKSRGRDKIRKKDLKEKQQSVEPVEAPKTRSEQIIVHKQHWLPWVLVIASWVGFAAYIVLYP